MVSYEGQRRPTPSRFVCHDATADSRTAAAIREQFSRWLRRSTDLDETRQCDVVLAVNEALANAVEFAYPDGQSAGTVDVEGLLDSWRAALSITVSDQGRWRDRDVRHTERSRGRGIPLMHAVADAVVIDTSALGTSVCLRFDNVPVAQRARVFAG